MDINFDKSLSRLAAIQVLYALDSKEEFEENIIDEEIKNIEKYYTELHNKNEIQKKLNPKFLKRLVKFTIQNLVKINSIINANINKTKPNTKINSLLKSILRIGICEISHFKTPPKVTINEYVKITKNFFNSEEIGFVNALLDAVKNTLKA